MKHADALAAKAADALMPLRKRFEGETALVFAPGPSLRKLWEGRHSDLPKIVVSDAYPLVPDADILCSMDAHWWFLRKGVPDFEGIKVGDDLSAPYANLIALQLSGRAGYDDRLGWFRSGHNSGHAAVHLAAQLGARRILLIGFDMKKVKRKDHCDGVQEPYRTPNYLKFIAMFEPLAKELKARGVEVLNATQGSALPWFPMVKLEDVR